MVRFPLHTGALLCAVVLLSAPSELIGAVTLPSLFSDHAVLQKAAKVPVWGVADPNEKVTVTLDGVTAESVAGTDGKWKVTLDLHDRGPGPFELVVEGSNRIVLSDILVGEVWICSGQSNMDFNLAGVTGAAEEIAKSANPMLRQFAVSKNLSATPLEELNGGWVSAGPATSAAFSAVGYYFGKHLQKELNTPVGLIFAAWGGTPIHTWMSEEAMDQNPKLKEQKDESKAITAAYPIDYKKYIISYFDWVKKYDRRDRLVADPQTFAAPEAAVTGWENVQLPGLLRDQKLPDSGAVWLRKEIEMPAEYAGNGLQVNLGKLRDFDTLYWDGVLVGKTSAKTPIAAQYLASRVYSIPGNLVHAGKTTLAIRLYSPGGDAGVTGGPLMAGAVPLDGQWLAKTEFELPTVPLQGKAEYPAQPSLPYDKEKTGTYLFNGMINPVIPYALQGAIWYQGESNVGDAPLYQRALTLLIEDWRAKWGQPEMGFYLCQLANFMSKPTEPSESTWADLREAQASLISLPNIGMAVLIDIGEEANIHPRNKKDAGERLAISALSKTYKRPGPFSGPLYSSMKVESNKVRLSFTNTDGGLVAKPLPETYQPESATPELKPLVRHAPGGDIEGFAVRDAKGKWSWAQAKIEENEVIVWAPGVSRPDAVRYAWANNPTCNLYNQAGLPAVPFRTDKPSSSAH